MLEAGQVTGAGPLGELLARIDLPVRLGEEAGVVLEARVSETDPDWHLARVDWPGGSLWVRDHGTPCGTPVRIRILARDVSLALEAPRHSSILNSLPATVQALADEPHPALALVRLDMGGTPLVARITRRSAAELGLHPGLALYAQIKAVAVIG